MSNIPLVLLAIHTLSVSVSWGDHTGIIVSETLREMFSVLKFSHCVLASGTKYAKWELLFILSRIPLGALSVQGVGYWKSDVDISNTINLHGGSERERERGPCIGVYKKRISFLINTHSFHFFLHILAECSLTAKMCRKWIFLHLCFVSAAWSIRRGSMRRLYCSNYSKIKWTSGSTTNCHVSVIVSASEVQAATSSTIRGFTGHVCKHQFPIYFTGRERERMY